MTTTFALQAASAARLDFSLLSRALLCVGLVLVLASPLSPDPFAFAAGAMVPWALVQIVNAPAMPAAILYWLLWQWLQTFARVLVGVVDGLPMSRSVFGPSVEDAYWYMLTSIVCLAFTVRMVLGNLRVPTERSQTWHLNWRPIDLFLVYIGSFVLSMVCAYAVRVVPALYQQIDAVAKFKLAATFMLFVSVLSQGRGYRLMLVTIAMELVMGLSGFLSDFRSVFVVLAMATIAARVRITPAAAAAAAAWLVALLGLSLFWTAVKMDYRDFATGAQGSVDEETQAITASFNERVGFLADRAITAADIDWDLASYNLLVRMAYVDIFGSVAGVNQFFGDQGVMRQWSDALSHVFQPRILFPNKPNLSDTEVYMRLTRADPTETVRMSTSISVGYLGENYADLHFPGMLLGVLMVGIIMAGVAKYFMLTPLPWMVRQSIVMAFVYAVAGTGVEVSLPKILGGAVMFGVVYALLIRFAFPAGIRWLDIRALRAQALQENVRRAAAAARTPRSRPAVDEAADSGPA